MLRFQARYYRRKLAAAIAYAGVTQMNAVIRARNSSIGNGGGSQKRGPRQQQ